MKDHLVDWDDKRKAMRQEAMEEQKAEARTAYFDAINEMDDIESLREELHSARENQREVDREIQQLERQIKKLQNKKERFEENERHLIHRLQELDPEVIVEVLVVDTKRFGKQVVTDVEKCPPILPDKNEEENDRAVAGIPISETVKEQVDSVTDAINPEEYDSNESVATLKFNGFEDEAPEIVWD